MSRQESGRLLVVFTLPALLKIKWAALKAESPLWEKIGQGVIVWSINEFINGRVQRPLIKELALFHDLFIKHAYATLSEIERGHWVVAAQWNKDNLQIIFSEDDRLVIPRFHRISAIDEPEIKRFEEKGLLLTKLIDTGIPVLSQTKMPGHYVPTQHRKLVNNHYDHTTLQKDFNAHPKSKISHLFLTLDNPSYLERLTFDFMYFFMGKTDSVKSPQLKFENEVSQVTKKPNKAWNNKPTQVSIEGKVYSNPHRAGDAHGIPVNQIYARCYGKEPKWKDWYFLGTRKDPKIH